MLLDDAAVRNIIAKVSEAVQVRHECRGRACVLS